MPSSFFHCAIRARSSLDRPKFCSSSSSRSRSFSSASSKTSFLLSFLPMVSVLSSSSPWLPGNVMRSIRLVTNRPYQSARRPDAGAGDVCQPGATLRYSSLVSDPYPQPRIARAANDRLIREGLVPRSGSSLSGIAVRASSEAAARIRGLPPEPEAS